MAEALGVFSAAISVADIAARTSSQLLKLARRWKRAPDLILALSNEAADLSVVLDSVGDFSETVDEAIRDNRLGQKEQKAIKAMDKQLALAKKYLDELEKLASDFNKASKIEQRFKWMTEESKAIVLKQQIRDSREKIDELIHIYTAFTSSRVRHEIHQGNALIITAINASQQNHLQLPQLIEHSTEIRTSVVDSRDAITSRLNTMEATLRESMRDTMQNVFQDLLRESLAQALPTAAASPNSTQLVSGSTARNIPPHTNQPPPRTFSYESVTAVGLICRRLPACLKSCRCRCHRPGNTRARWEMPRALRSVLGTLFVGYSGLPMGVTRCDDSSCSAKRGTRVDVTYMFPAWALKSAVYISVDMVSLNRPVVGLMMCRRAKTEYGSLMAGAQRGDVKLVKTLLEQNPAVISDIDEWDGGTALHRLVRAGAGISVELARVFVSAGIDVDREDDFGMGARTWIAQYFLLREYPGQVRDELDALFHISSHIETLEIPYLHKVAMGYCAGDIALAIERHDSSDLDQIDVFGSTPLHWAVGNSDTTATGELLGAGAWVDARDAEGETPLCVAARWGCTECAKLLLAAGADQSAINSYSRHPLHYAAWNGHPDVVLLLLAAAGVDVDCRDKDGRTSLHFALLRDEKETASILLDHNADIEAANIVDRTPLLDAIVGNATACLQLLLSHNANYTRISSSENSALHYAALYATTPTMHALTRAKLKRLNVHARNLLGKTPIDTLRHRLDCSAAIEHAFHHLIDSIDATAYRYYDSEYDSECSICEESSLGIGGYEPETSTAQDTDGSAQNQPQCSSRMEPDTDCESEDEQFFDASSADFPAR